MQKKDLLNVLAILPRKYSVFEQGLVSILSNKSLHFKFKAGAIAYAYKNLTSPEYRVADLDGYKVYVNIVEHDGNCLYFFRKNPEEFSTNIVKGLLSKSDICLDVGANIGYYSMLMANVVGQSGKVFCFEANPNLHEMILKSIDYNHFDRVCAEKLAVSSTSGQVLKFFVSTNPNNSGTSSLIDHGVYVNKDNYIRVETVSLDDYFEANSINYCKLVKIDVERAEADVVKGMEKILQNRIIDYIILEQNFNGDAQTIIESFDYSCWFIDENDKTLTNVKNLSSRDFGNFLFVKASCLDVFKKQHATLIRDN